MRHKDYLVKQLSNIVGELGFTLILHELAKMADDIDNKIAKEIRHSRNRTKKIDTKLKKVK